MAGTSISPSSSNSVTSATPTPVKTGSMSRRYRDRMVWFCLACDDQPPWKADEKKPCPTCKSTDSVKEATRFGNMEDVDP